MNRYLAFAVVPLIAIGVINGASSTQPHATNDLDPRLAGYPELSIRLTEERIETPATASAGPTLLVEEQTGEGVGHAFVLRVPDDVAEEAVVDALNGGPAVEETPEWFWRAEFLGNGDRAAPDRPAVSLVDLRAGRYIVGDPYRPATEYARFTVSDSPGVSAASIEIPEIDVVGELFEMGFRLPAEIPAGRQLWEVRNTGAMLHEIAILPVPAESTSAQVEAAIIAELEVEQGGDPAAARALVDALGPRWAGWASDLVAGVGVLSPQRVSWAQFDLAPGTYGAVCFIPDPATGTPHLMLGMTSVFIVEEMTA